MAKKYTSEQFWKLYENLPQELKDALFAEETGNYIYEICQRNEIEEKLEEIVDLAGQVLVGVLAPENFQTSLEKDIGLEKETAKKVAQEINRFIFYPVKSALEGLYKIATETPTEEKGETKPELKEPSLVISENIKGEEKPVETLKKDVYREPVE